VACRLEAAAAAKDQNVVPFAAQRSGPRGEHGVTILSIHATPISEEETTPRCIIFFDES
jgi:hypothetical protein